jgi:hypothetical protein
MTPEARKAKSAGGKSPVVRARKVPEKIQRMLWGLTAGRCEFAGCNKDLFEHSVTLLAGNFAQVAHIVAFRDGGARGNDEYRPKDVHDLANLMLLCTECHKLIDDRPAEFARETLIAYKREHEDRVRHVTGFDPDMKTSVVQLKALIAGRAIDIPVKEVCDAVAPRWPTDRKGHLIDLTGFDVETAAGTASAVQRIDGEVQRLYAPGMAVATTRHISLFALAPIHILAHLGSRLSDKIATDFYQRHRDIEASPWQWRNCGKSVTYCDQVRQKGLESSRVALVLSLSGPIPGDALPAHVDESYWVYEVTLKDIEPDPGFLRSRDGLERFRHWYRAFLSRLTNDHGILQTLDIYPAVPAPIGVVLGYDLLPKVHPALRMFDYDKDRKGFTEKLVIGAATRHAGCGDGG